MYSLNMKVIRERERGKEFINVDYNICNYELTILYFCSDVNN